MKPSIRLRTVLAGAAVCLLLAAPRAAAQCAMCKEAVDGSKAAGGGLADGISASILFMLSLPLLIGGGFGVAIWWAYHKARNGPVDGI